MRSAYIAIVISFFISIPAGHAQTIELRRPLPPNEASPEIIGGKKADVASWPATFVFKSAAGNRCTATAIGPRALLTAAHCISGGVTGRIVDTALTLTCEVHDYYSSGSNYDVAMCVTSGTVMLEGNAPFEAIDAVRQPATGDSVTLLGYGCVSEQGSGGVLYEGASYVQQPAAGTKPYFVTRGGAAVCSGDSGGGAYRVSGQFSRRVVGVASASVAGGQSNFSPLGDPDIVRFIRRWAATRVDPVTKATLEVKICGLDSLYTCHP